MVMLCHALMRHQPIEESAKTLERGLALYIKVGKLMNRSVILKLVKAIPPEDLEGLKSICVRTLPHRSTKKRERRWGGLRGQHAGHGDENTSKIWIYLWGITQGVFKKFRYGQSNLYDSFIEEFARVLYHEVGHHVHSKTKEYKALGAQLKTMRAKLLRVKKKQAAPIQFPPISPQMEEYWNIKRQFNALRDEIEHFADQYAKKALSKAREMSLLNAPHPTDISFFKIIRDKWIDSWFQHYYEMKQRGKRQYIGWPKILGVFDHLRKCKLRGEVKYNLRELFIEIYGRYPERNELRRFKRFALKRVKPLWYVSKRGRKYAYFTKAQMNELKRHKPEFTQHCNFHQQCEIIEKAFGVPAPKKEKEPEDIALSHTLRCHRLVLWSLNCRLLFILPFEDWDGLFIRLARQVAQRASLNASLTVEGSREKEFKK